MLEDGSAPIWVQANELLMREALTNLIDNAVQYAGAHSQVTVRVAQDETSSQALLQVSDTGPGLTRAERDIVFERFVRVSAMGQGCGLGLAIVKEIVERHHGRVEMTAVLPHGLQVSILLPMAPLAEPQSSLATGTRGAKAHISS
jgi:two-component system sensor histidine kinase TctE